MTTSNNFSTASGAPDAAPIQPGQNLGASTVAVAQSAIPVDTLPTPSITPPVVTPPPVDTTNHTAIIAGAVPTPTTNQSTSTTPATDASTALIGKIKDLMGMDTGKTQATANALDSSGATAIQARQNELSSKLTALNNESQAIPLKNENAAIGITGETGVNAQNTIQLRNNAIQALSLKSEYDLNAGQLQNAKDNAQRAVDLVYKPIEDQIAQSTTMLNLYKPFMDQEQTTKANALILQNQQKATALADSKKQQQDVINAAQTNGDSASASAALKLDPNSSTFTDDLAKIQAGIAPKAIDPLDKQYKELQIQELTQKINAAGTASDLTGLVSPVVQLPDGTYDSTTQEAILSKMSPQDASLVREVGNYQMDISKITSLRSDQRQKLAAEVALVYPGFDMSKYSTNAAYKKSLTSGAIYNGIVAANKSISHLVSFADVVSQIPNSGANSTINKINNALAYNFSPTLQTNLSTANTEAAGLKDELAKFFKGTGSTDVKSIDEWSKQLDVNSTPAKLKGTVQGAITLLAGQLDVLSQQYKQTLGSDPTNQFLQPATLTKLSNLKNQGYQVDIPGVYYTDKAAWEKYGGGSESSLTDAYNTLKAAGIPTTAENILQAAQL